MGDTRACRKCAPLARHWGTDKIPRWPIIFYIPPLHLARENRRSLVERIADASLRHTTAWDSFPPATHLLRNHRFPSGPWEDVGATQAAGCSRTCSASVVHFPLTTFELARAIPAPELPAARIFPGAAVRFENTPLALWKSTTTASSSTPEPGSPRRTRTAPRGWDAVIHRPHERGLDRACWPRWWRPTAHKYILPILVASLELRRKLPGLPVSPAPMPARQAPCA